MQTTSFLVRQSFLYTFPTETLDTFRHFSGKHVVISGLLGKMVYMLLADCVAMAQTVRQQASPPHS